MIYNNKSEKVQGRCTLDAPLKTLQVYDIAMLIVFWGSCDSKMGLKTYIKDEKVAEIERLWKKL